MYRFAFDIGAASLGWAVHSLGADRSPVGLERLGVRIFPTGRNPKSKESNAAGRRGPRQQRRQIDRRNSRRKLVLERLVESGLLPSADRRCVFLDQRQREACRECPSADRRCIFGLDPYDLRARAACERIDLHELGRAIWHISKHRGFKSNRKTDRSADDSGKIASAADELQQMLDSGDYPTYGAWLAARHDNGETVRIRPQGKGSKLAYAFYPIRVMLEAEFDHIWRTQAEFHPELTDARRERVRDAVFWQRPLRPVDPGRCTFFPDRPRLARWHPLAQEFVVLQQVNSLRLIDQGGERPLDRQARDLIAQHLTAGKKLTWAGLRRLLDLSRDTEINLEKGKLKELAYDTVAARLLGTTRKPGPLKDTWPGMAAEERLRVLNILDESQDPAETVERLMREIGLPREAAESVEKIALPDGHLRICEDAARAIVHALRDDVVPYSRAVESASERGYFGDEVVLHHSDLRSDEFYDRLPPYNRVPVLQRMIGNGTGNPDDTDLLRFGRITNPTVHIALGQFRRVINALIAEYGKPEQIVIETARDMAKSAVELNEIDRTIRSNERRNDNWRVELEEAGVLAPGQRVGDRFLRMRLWEELGTGPADRVCPYSGATIALHQLHSDAVEIDHILPFEDTFDDSPANKTVCFREENRRKGKRAPGDAWSGAELDAIIARVKAVPGFNRKAWRFLPGAMDKWQAERDFEDRQLHATGYLARMVRAYATTLFPRDGTSSVWVLPGRMTAMLRRRWGLHLPDHNAKTRLDHRHHALDAAVIGVVDRAMVQRLQTLARRHSADGLESLLPDLPEPFADFCDQVTRMVGTINVSHRPSRSTSGRLHEDTAYGLVRNVPENQAALTIGNLVVRKPTASLKPKEIGQVRDVKLREQLQAATKDVRADKKLLAEQLARWSEETGHRRLRILKPEAGARPVNDANGTPRKWLVPGEIAWLDILESSDGRWFHHPTDIWAANAGGSQVWQQLHPDARFVMRLHKNDTVQLFDLDRDGEPIDGTNQVKRVVRLNPQKSRIYLAGANDAGDLQNRNADQDDPFRWDLATIGKLKPRRARRVRVDELGKVRTIPQGAV